MEPTMTPRSTRTACISATRGLTLIDLLCVLAVTAVLMGGALPGWRAFQQAQVLRGVTETVETDVQYARTVAMTTDRTVRLSVQRHPDGGSCTLVHLGSASACTCSDDSGRASCGAGGELLRVSVHKMAQGAALTSLGKSLVFDAGKGTVSPTATLLVQDGDGRVVRQIINIMGRVRNCSPDGLAGFPACA